MNIFSKFRQTTTAAFGVTVYTSTVIGLQPVGPAQTHYDLVKIQPQAVKDKREETQSTSPILRIMLTMLLSLGSGLTLLKTLRGLGFIKSS